MVNIASAIKPPSRLTSDSAASESNPTEPVMTYAVALSAMVSNAAAMESQAKPVSDGRFTPSGYEQNRTGRKRRSRTFREPVRHNHAKTERANRAFHFYPQPISALLAIHMIAASSAIPTTFHNPIGANNTPRPSSKMMSGNFLLP